LLRDALATLALPASDQVRANGPGCVACDLSEAFYHANGFALESAPALSDRQRDVLAKIDATLRGMPGPDIDCGNNEVVRRPAWQAVRELAAEALRSFGWLGAQVQPFVEVEPGVWHRPLAEAEQDAAADGGRDPGS
jgi:hypothetical protein